MHNHPHARSLHKRILGLVLQRYLLVGLDPFLLDLAADSSDRDLFSADTTHRTRCASWRPANRIITVDPSRKTSRIAFSAIEFPCRMPDATSDPTAGPL